MSGMQGDRGGPRRLGALEPRCPRCAYDLAPSASDHCPECGAPREMRLACSAAHVFAAAHAALAPHGLVLRATEPHDGGLGHVMDMVAPRPQREGAIWIDARRADEAASLLAAAEVATDDLAVPIVDRSDPHCPTCGADLDPDGPSECTCGTRFDWVDIEEPAIDTTGLACPACGYDLTGLAEARCPECGGLVPPDLDALVARATGGAEAPEAGAGRRSTWFRDLLVATAIALAFAVGLRWGADEIVWFWLILISSALLAARVAGALYTARHDRRG